MPKPPGRIKALSALIKRSLLSSLAGRSHSDARDVYKVAGYEEDPTFKEFADLYRREEIAAIVVDSPAQATWRSKPKVVDDDDPQNDTEFEVAWESIVKRLGVYHYLERVDRLSGIGEYGVLFLGLKDGIEPSTPAVTSERGPDSLLYLQAFNEKHATVESWITDTQDPRFNQPEIYHLDFGAKKVDALKSDTNVAVHHSRVIHVAEGLLENEVYGEPRMQKVYNRLKDLQKVVSGSAEMFWKSARMGIHVNVEDGFGTGDLSGDIDGAFDKLQDELDEYDHQLSRWIRTEGVDIKSLGSEVVDPSKIFNMLISLISAKTGIPQRILLGSERGELASTQDEKNWATKVMGRQEQFGEPQVLRPFIDTLILVGVLPEPSNKEGYSVIWPNLTEDTPKEKADVFDTKMTSLKNYVDAVQKDEAVAIIIDANEIREGLGYEPRSEKEIAGLLEGMKEEPLEEEDEEDEEEGQVEVEEDEEEDEDDEEIVAR